MKLQILLVCSLWMASHALAAEFKLGLVLDKGGRDDKSFNSSAFKGAMKVKDELKASVKYVEATDDNAFEPLLRSLAQKNYDLIIAIGVSQVEALGKVAQQFPNTHFAIVDGEVKQPNVRSLLFDEQEGSYLVGAIAALTSKASSIGFIGGMDIPLIRRFATGYIEGAKSIKPGIKVISNYVGVTPEAWNNPAKAKELAVTQYEMGADIIFSASGASGTGIFDAAEEKKKLAIGVDSNQNWVKPGFVLTSMVKRIDQAVYSTSKDTIEGKFTGGVHRFGLANQGVDYSMDQYNDKLMTADVRKKAEDIKAQIIKGKIKVTDSYKVKK